MTAMIRDRRWLLALVVAVITAMSGVLLVGVSSWFLGAVALAGLGPAAFAFNFHFPAALVRGLALLRTGGKYAERNIGHAAALSDQLAHRRALFTRMMGDPDVRAQGWQLARSDRLQNFLDDVEAVDFARLRAVLPAVAIAATGGMILALTITIALHALPALLLEAGTLVAAALVLDHRAADRQGRAAAIRSAAGERLGLELGGLVSLQASGTRRAVIGTSFAQAREAERLARSARQHLQAADVLLGAFGPLAALTVVAAARGSGLAGEPVLPVILTAFSWLAFGEVVLPLARSRFASLEGRRGAEALAHFREAPEVHPRPVPSVIRLQNEPLVDPRGEVLGGRISFEAKPRAPVAVLGPSGCGKTSLLKRLAGWLPWYTGPHPLGGEVSAQAASHLSLHDAAVLDGTLRDNLFTDARDAQIHAVLLDVELSERVRELGGLDARVRQDTLSLGEARRLALARAILAPQPILLLDEPGEHLDQAQAERVLRRLLLRARQKTVVFVTHERNLASLARTVVDLGRPVS